ncbi:MAG: hypothetical protein CFH06_01228, partial [Alphaproteobacteria bacterium MarineAlpha3_Bin5]
GEAQDVVDLVGIVTSTGRHDHVVAGRDGRGVVDLGVRIGAGEDDGVGRHRQEHLRGDESSDRQAQEGVRAHQGVRQVSRLGLPDEASLEGIGHLPFVVEYTAAVAHEHVVRVQPQLA